MKSRDRIIDGLAIVFLLAIAWSYGLWLNFNRPPFEDAAMIMRYAEHVAAGHGIVWNVGQPPVDGATDFLFLLVIAGLHAIGFGVEKAIQYVTFSSHLLTVIAVYLGNRRLWHAPVPIAIFLSWYLAAGTGLSYVTAYFGTPFFALFATLTWIVCLRMIVDGQSSIRTAALFSLLAFLTGLIRPDGVLLVALMAIGLPIAMGWDRSRTALVTFATVFGVLGVAYFLWRWHYFGYPLPNPYYKKGAGVLHWDALRSSTLGFARFSWPLLPTFALGFRSWTSARRTAGVLLAPVAFAIAFILISDEMNFGGRFQYVTLPLMLLVWLMPIGDLSLALRRLWSAQAKPLERMAWAAAASLAGFMAIRYSAAQRCVFLAAPEVCLGGNVGSSGSGPMGALLRVGQALSKYRDPSYVLATTEAGLLPYYSGWTSVDLWGLNDQWIAHHNGQVTAEYLDRWHPHVVVSHAYFSPQSDPANDPHFRVDPWNQMTLTVREYVLARHYRLAAAFGTPEAGLHYYYIRPDFPDRDAIVSNVRTIGRTLGLPNRAPEQEGEAQ